jgi:hypothetical protein
MAGSEFGKEKAARCVQQDKAHAHSVRETNHQVRTGEMEQKGAGD